MAFPQGTFGGAAKAQRWAALNPKRPCRTIKRTVAPLWTNLHILMYNAVSNLTQDLFALTQGITAMIARQHPYAPRSASRLCLMSLTILLIAFGSSSVAAAWGSRVSQILPDALSSNPGGSSPFMFKNQLFDS